MESLIRRRRLHAGPALGIPRRTPREGGLLVLSIVGSLTSGALIGWGYGPYMLLGVAAAGAFAVSWVAARAVIATPAMVPYWGVCAGVALISWNGVRVSGNVTASDLLLAVSAVLVVVGLALRSERLRPPPIPGWLIVGVGLLLLAALLVEMFPSTTREGLVFDRMTPILPRSAGAAESVGGNLVIAARFLVALIVVPILIATVCTTYQRASTVATTWLLGVGASCLVAVVAAFTPTDLAVLLTGNSYTYDRPGLETVRYTGLTLHPNHLGISASIAAPLALIRLRGSPAVYAPLVGLYAMAILLSGSRAAFAALIAAVAIVAYTQPLARRPIAVMGAVAALLSWRFLATADLAVIGRLREPGSAVAASDNIRRTVLAETADLFFQRPLVGHGFELIRGANNLVLQLLTAGGLIALTGYSLVAGGIFRLGWRLVRHARLPAPTRVLVAGCTASFAVMLIVSMVSNAIMDRYVYVPAAVILAVFAVRPGLVRG